MEENINSLQIGDKVKIYDGSIGIVKNIFKNECGKYEVEVAIEVTETLDLDMIEKI